MQSLISQFLKKGFSKNACLLSYDGDFHGRFYSKEVVRRKKTFISFIRLSSLEFPLLLVIFFAQYSIKPFQRKQSTKISPSHRVNFPPLPLLLPFNEIIWIRERAERLQAKWPFPQKCSSTSLCQTRKMLDLFLNVHCT